MSYSIAIHLRRIGDFVRAIKAHRGKRALGKALSVSVFNQLLSSATNFAVGLYLLRMLPQEEFGLFSIGFAITLFFGGIGNALLLIHMVVQIPHKSPSTRHVYVARMLVALFVFCLLSVLLAASAVALALLMLEPVTGYFDLAIAITAASVLYLLKDFFIRYGYSEHKEIWAFKINLMIAAATASQFLIFDVDSAAEAMWTYAAGQFGGVIAGFFLAKLPIGAVALSDLRSDMREAWHVGRWNVSTNIISWVRTQAYVTFTAAIAGPAGVATLNAVRLLFTPAIFLLPAVGQLVLPRLAKIGVHNRSGVVRVGLLVVALILAVSLAYSIFLLFFLESAAAIVLGSKYKNLDDIAFAWGVFIAAHVVAVGSTLVLQALREYSVVAVAGVVGTMSMFTALYPLYDAFDIGGVIYAMALGELAIAATMSRKIFGLKN